MGRWGCYLARNKMLSAITFSMLFIFYLVAVKSYIASARQNGNWAEQTKISHPSSFFCITASLFFISWLFSPFASSSWSFVSFMVRVGRGCVSMFCVRYRRESKLRCEEIFFLLLLSSFFSCFLFRQEVSRTIYQLFRHMHIPWNVCQRSAAKCLVTSFQP